MKQKINHSQCAGKFLLQQRMHSNHANPDKLRKSNIKGSLSPEEFQLVEQFYQYSYKQGRLMLLLLMFLL